MSSIIAIKLYDHMNQCISSIQKDIGTKLETPNITSIIHNKVITQDPKSHQANLLVACMNYRKSLDSIPYIWIYEYLALCKINRILKTFIKNSKGLWKTILEKDIIQHNDY